VKTLFFIFIGLASIFAIGCGKIKPTVRDVQINFLVQDTSGNDLFDSATKGHYNIDSVKTYYFDEQGQKIEVYYANLDNPRQIWVYDDGPPIPVLVGYNPYLGKSSSTEFTTNLIQWTENDIDTIVTKIRKQGGSMFIDQVTVNGKDLYVEGVNPYNTYFGSSWVSRLVTLVK